MQDETYTRDEWLRLLGFDAHERLDRTTGLKANTFNQRLHKGDIALAFGLSRPVHQNEYSPLDAFAVLLTHMLSAFAKVELRVAAEMVRVNWLAWLKGLAQLERDASPNDYVFAIGATLGDDASQHRFSSGAGKRQDAIAEVERAGTHYTIYVMPLQFALRQLRTNARVHNVKLPQMLTAASPADHEAFEEWLGVIEEYRRLSHRRTAAKKAKQARARVLA